jgi:hypothetical protein
MNLLNISLIKEEEEEEMEDNGAKTLNLSPWHNVDFSRLSRLFPSSSIPW